MSILKKPYEISVWEDRWDSDQGKFVEARLGVIGSDKMVAQCRAIEPNLVRNVNGTKKFSFKMYKQYVDTMTGEKVSNPFSDWLISERKVKLHYEDQWFDFIIKDIAESSSNYLRTYQLEDALVQELSKNGFGVTLDAQLMNNMGTAGELGAKVLEETDWTVQSEVFVQKVEEALVYVQVGEAFTATKILDQTDLGAGVSTVSERIVANSNILAFYSSCTEQPYRFQFIKLDNYAKDEVLIDENRVINMPDCQYYYDVLSIENATYTKTREGFYLPAGWEVLTKNENGPVKDNGDTSVSGLYRGARYGFAQDAEYVPLLDRYCQKFFPKENSNIFNAADSSYWRNDSTFHLEQSDGVFSMVKNDDDMWDGLQFQCGALSLQKNTPYRLSYQIEWTKIGENDLGTLKNIGGHTSNLKTNFFAIYSNIGTKAKPNWAEIKTGATYNEPIEYEFEQDKEYRVVVELLSDSSGTYDLYIQPNRGISDPVSVKISNIELKYGAYYAFVDNTYTSPALVRNVISSPNGEKTSGWSAAKTTSAGTKPEIESVYGRINKEKKKFISIIDDLQGAGITYTDPKTGEQKTYDYKSYLKVKFTAANQYLINSGFYDNRTLIGSVTTGEKWVLNQTILDPTLESENKQVTPFSYTLQEVSYNTDDGKHDIATITPGETLPDSVWAVQVDDEPGLLEFKRGKGVSKKEFKKKKIKLVISPSSSNINKEFYIENLELYKAVPKTEGGTDYISPGELDQSGVITTAYNFFSPAALEAVETAEELACEKVDKSELYTKYTPVFNENAEKVRSVTAKESNYFNILQSIAETFECWLSLEVGRNADGAITSKVAKFKNYAGNDNYAAFRYGVNLKDIQRTYTSKNIVTKLMVKANSNEHAQDGFCTIQRAGANPTGESYLYDFQYYHNKGLLHIEDYMYNYCMEDAAGSDMEYMDGYEFWYSDSDEKPSTPQGDNPTGWSKSKTSAIWYSIKHENTWTTPLKLSQMNLNGYYPRLKALNNLLLPINQSIIDLNADLTTLRAEEAVEEGLYYAAKEGIEEVSEDFKALTNLDFYNTYAQNYEIIYKVDDLVSDELNTEEWAKGATITCDIDENDHYTWTFVIDLAGKYAPGLDVAPSGSVFRFKPSFSIEDKATQKELLTKAPLIETVFPPGADQWIFDYKLDIIDDSSKVRELQKQFELYTTQLQNSLTKLGKEPDVESGTPAADSIKSAIAAKEAALIAKEAERDKYLTHKKALNRLFFEKYARFIQEGTWISEEYIDDDKYYTDAQSVLYNSCYPRVAYTINVLALSALPGYELFKFELGDKTYAEDPEFFEAEGGRVEVIISEKSENLDDPTKDVIRVQNFKNQFQDLFQKITATVQQTQYSTGAYKKAVALAEADAEGKGDFLSEALSKANTKLSAAGQTTVEQSIDGITLTDNKTKDKMRLIGGAILMGVLDENGERKWKTGLTPEGISASLVTAGTINTGSIAIMDGNNPAFRWDAFGISAFNADWDANGIQGTPDKTKFVRFDKHGIYGIDGGGVDGTSWKPGINDPYKGKPFDEIDAKSTFALTWKGLKVTGENGSVVKIGKQNDYIMLINDAENDAIFSVKTSGQVYLAGWNVTPNTLWYDGTTTQGNFNNIGKQNTFGIYPKGITSGLHSDFGGALETNDSNEPIDAWVMTAGDSFGITKNGVIFANAGKIGSMTIDAISNLPNQVVGKNLAKDSQNGELIPSDKGYERLQYWLSKTLNNNEEYLVSVWIENNDEGIELSTTLSNGATSNTQIYSSQTIMCNNGYGFVKISKSYDGQKKDISHATHLEVYKGKSGETNRNIKILKVKLEKGTIATDWCHADEDNAKQNLFNPDWLQTYNVGSYGPSITGKTNGWNMISETNKGNCGIKLLSSTFMLNQKYVLTYKFKITGGTLSSIGGHSIWYNTTAFIVDGKNTNNNPHGGIDLDDEIITEEKNEAKVHTVEWHFSKLASIADPINNSDQNLYIQVNRKNDSTAVTFDIWDIKLEIGDVATIWTPFIAGTATNVSGDFSWKFSPAEGMFMWDGQQHSATDTDANGNQYGSTRGAIFAIYKDPDTNQHRLFVKGDIEADGGKIGGYRITQNSLFSDYITIRNNNIKVTGTSDNGIIFNGLSIKNVDDQSTLISASPSLTLTGGKNGAEIVLDNRGKNSSILKFIPCMYQNSAGYGHIYIKITEITNPENWGSRDIELCWHFYVPDSWVASNRNLSGSITVTIPTAVKVGDTIDVTDQSAIGLDLHDTFTDYVGIEYGALEAQTMAQTKKYVVNMYTTKANPREFPEMSTAYFPPTQQIIIKGNLLAKTENSSIGANGEGRWDRIFCQECQQGIDWSDSRKKNSIQSLDERYEVFFDKIKPTRYKYNEGTSNRYHTGFIAQSLVASLEESGLTTLDFAAVCLEDKDTENECWYLRRDEFVALNTWQIQKLKPRVSSLEQTILDYETRISSLEQKVQSLTSDENSAII